MTFLPTSGWFQAVSLCCCWYLLICPLGIMEKTGFACFFCKHFWLRAFNNRNQQSSFFSELAKHVGQRRWSGQAQHRQGLLGHCGWSSSGRHQLSQWPGAHHKVVFFWATQRHYIMYRRFSVWRFCLWFMVHECFPWNICAFLCLSVP